MDSAWVTMLDLKNAFFGILLDIKSQFIFAFEWAFPEGWPQELTWTVLPQVFRDIPYLFGQSLDEDLTNLQLDKA